MIDKTIWWLQLVLPVALLVKVIIAPYIYKAITKSPSDLSNESDVRRYYHKRERKTNELHTLTFFLYSLLIVWLNWPKILNIVEHFVSDIGNVGNYVGAIIEIGFIVVLQLHIYKYAIAQKMSIGNSINRLSVYRDNNEKLVRNIYVFLIIEVFLQASIVGLIPFFQIDRYVYVDITVVAVLIIALVHILNIQAIVHVYSHQHLYLRTWTTFVVATIFNNIANTVLTLCDGYLNMPFDSMSVLMWLLFRTMWILSTMFQCGCLAVNIAQTSSMEEWYDD